MPIDLSQMRTRDPLSDLTIKFMNEKTSFIGPRVFRPVVVSKEQGKYYQYDKSNLRRVSAKSNSKAKANLIDYGMFSVNYNTELRKLGHEIDPNDKAQADAAVADMETDAADNLAQAHLIDYELECVTKLTTAANYMAANTSAIADGVRWDDDAGAPIDDALVAHQAIRSAIGKPGNKLLIGWLGLQKLRRNAQIREQFKYTKSQLASDQDLKDVMMVDEIIVASSVYNAVAEGQAEGALTDSFGAHAIFFYEDPGAAAGKRVVTFANSFVADETYSYSWEDEARGGPKGRVKVYEMGWNVIPNFTAVESSSSSKAAAGYLFQNVYGA